MMARNRAWPRPAVTSQIPARRWSRGPEPLDRIRRGAQRTGRPGRARSRPRSSVNPLRPAAHSVLLPGQDPEGIERQLGLGRQGAFARELAGRGPVVGGRRPARSRCRSRRRRGGRRGARPSCLCPRCGNPPEAAVSEAWSLRSAGASSATRDASRGRLAR
ncbi:MAG: hypothetical protein MZU84_09110 [Sphingobacterium sp.]|nr:hypothetical protein [Sphingobacterium sp.]